MSGAVTRHSPVTALHAASVAQRRSLTFPQTRKSARMRCLVVSRNFHYSKITKKRVVFIPQRLTT